MVSFLSKLELRDAEIAILYYLQKLPIPRFSLGEELLVPFDVFLHLRQLLHLPVVLGVGHLVQLALFRIRSCEHGGAPPSASYKNVKNFQKWDHACNHGCEVEGSRYLRDRFDL